MITFFRTPLLKSERVLNQPDRNLLRTVDSLETPCRLFIGDRRLGY